MMLSRPLSQLSKSWLKGIYERMPLKANHNWLTSSLISPFATLNYKFE